MSRHNSLMVLFLTLLLIPSLAAAKKSKPKIGLTGKFEPISAAEMALKEIPSAPGAPAVILFEGEEYYFAKPATGAALTRTIYQYRIKILDESGVEEYGDFFQTYNADIEGLKVRARTILPDGTEIDASENINRDRSETGQQILSLAFPKVQVERFSRSSFSTTSRVSMRSDGRCRGGYRHWTSSWSTPPQTTCRCSLPAPL